MKPYTLFLIIVLTTMYSCRKDPAADYVNPYEYNTDWSETTHGNTSPDYNTVFPQNQVNKIEITIGFEKWTALRNNMINLFGVDFGANTAGTGGAFPNEESEYIDVDMRFGKKLWKNVGFRLKGNSTLRSAWNSGNYKLPFRLNFDEFEDNYPGIKNQHFYGFEELSFSPGYKDQSLIREKLASDIYRLGGIPSAQTAFYRVYVDIGTGLKYWGLYCGVELPDDNMIKNQLGEENGNIYKPESRLNIFNQIEFEKKNNTDAADYSDVINLINKINSSTRISNPEQWKIELESVFNVDEFLNWLAINNAIVNWDSYGAMAHNYYLYNHSLEKFMWIPWDNNEAFSRSPGIIGATGGNGINGLSLSMNEVTLNWPLIRYLADDPVYFQRYKTLMKNFKDNVFTSDAMNNLIDKYYELVTPFAIGIDGEQPGYTYLMGSDYFTNEKTNLKTHVVNRRNLIATFVP